MRYVLMGVAVVAVMMLLFSCRSQKNAADKNVDSIAIGSSPVRNIGDKPEGADRSLIDSEKRFAGEVVHFQPDNRVHIIGGRPTAVLPRGVAFRMSGDYADNLPLNLSADGVLESYPAPSDISADSAPIPLADGWWLDRRGVTEGTVFSRYTLAQYAAMKEVPSQQELLASVIPGAKVTAVAPLPMMQHEALADTAAVNAWLRANRFGLGE